MNGKVVGFCSILRFRWMYCTFAQKTWRVICLFTFCASSAELVRGLLSTGGCLYGDIAYSILVAVVSLISLTKDVLSLFPKSETKVHLTRFQDRVDTQSLSVLQDSIRRISPAKTELENGFERIDVPKSDDFVVVSRKLDDFLEGGGKIWCEIRCFQDTPMWRRINRRLDEASHLLSLKQRADRYVDFFNEDKVMLSSGFLLSPNAKETCLTVAKTCYYASYLSNEFYRDCVVDEDGISRSEGLEGVWSPFDESVEGLSLHELSGGVSAHVGVNAIGVTKDGYVLIWQQGSGQHSCCQAAPTGSGSMDWKDLEASHPTRDGTERILFNDVITYAAERELREESFAGARMEGLKTRVIGYFRWGRRGGLPGFVCLTKIPILRDELVIRNSEVCRNRVLEQLRLSGSTGEMVASIDAYVKACEGRLRMSLPLFIGLRCLRESLASGKNIICDVS